ncbi:S9 family peptidase [Candidatus Geothermarchaeota archaeon]|nr:MAG: S9 family peptidase [Candidatus Geothermarchaeota archaeon]
MAELIDPYEWMENLSDERVQKFIDDENKKTSKALSDFSVKLKNELIKYYSLPYLISALVTERGYFFLIRDAKQFKVKLIERSGKVIDLIASKELGDQVIIKWIYAPKSGKLLAFSYSIAGLDEGVTAVMDVEEKEIIDEIRGVIHDLTWINDEKYYYVKFYRKEKTPDGVSPPTSRVFLREDGRDEMVFGEGIGTSYFINLQSSVNGSQALLTVSYGWTRSTIYGGPLSEPDRWTKVYGDGDFIVKPIDYLNDRYLLISYEGESCGKIISVNGSGKIDLILDDIGYPVIDATTLKEIIVANYLVNASSKIKLIELSGKVIDEVAFNVPGTVSSLNSIGSEVLFKYESFSIPYRAYSLSSNDLRIIDSCEVNGSYVIDEEWVKSRDGTSIHMFIFRKRNSVGDKVLIYGYGGFSIPLTPRSAPYVLPFVNVGGTYVVANIRGGSEFGEKWHRMGMRENKQNVFDDFIACIEYFKNKGAKVVAIGRSNGGLLVAAVLTQRPDLLDGAVIGYPVIDMMKFHKLYIGRAWVPEYGDPDDPKDRVFLLKYSPYHNVRNVKYPPVFIYTGLHDDRVHPAHALKFTAKLKEVNAPVLLRVETSSGHSGAVPEVKIREEADILSFVFKVLDMNPGRSTISSD